MTDRDTLTHCKRPGRLDRRGFLAGTAALGLTVVKPEHVFGSQANSKIELGMIGCGGRGNWIADLFKKHGKYQLVAPSQSRSSQ